MTEKRMDRGGAWSSIMVGKSVGAAFGLSLAVLLSMRATWVQLLLSFTPIITPIPFLSVFVLAAVIGGVIGAGLAKIDLVPALSKPRTLSIAVLVAIAPVAVGFTEVWMRGAPIALPPGSEVVSWKREPWGNQILHLTNPEQVATLQEQLVRSAQEAGWNCRYCQYQPTIDAGIGNFEYRDANPHGLHGSFGFEVWSGELQLYGAEPSTLSQIRISHSQRTWSVEWTVLVVSALLLAGLLCHARYGRAT